MFKIYSSDDASAPSALAHFATRSAAKVGALMRAQKNRRALYAMGHMSDHELSDIGLTRSDLYSVRAGPLFLDPTVRLGVLACTNGSAAPCCNA